MPRIEELPAATSVSATTEFVGSEGSGPNDTKRYPFSVLQDFIVKSADIYAIMIKVNLFPILVFDTILAKVNLNNNPRVTSVNMNQVITVNKNMIFASSDELTDLSATALQSVGNEIQIANNAKLTSINFQSLTELGISSLGGGGL